MKSKYKGHNKYNKYMLLVFAAVLSAALALCLTFYSFSIQKAKEASETENVMLKVEIEELNKKIDELTLNKHGIKEHGRLKLKGTDIVDQYGKVMTLRGISSHGLSWFPEYTNYRALKTLKKYGFNVFRIAMYTDQKGGYIDEPEINRKLLYAAIENSLSADMYTIVDWHVLKDQNPKKYMEEAVKEFTELAKRYGDEPGLIYEICNEPNGDTSYKDIYEYAEEIIPAIRKYAPNSIILVGTPKYCTRLSDVIEYPLNYDNIMYTFHYYSEASDLSYSVNEIQNAVSAGIPVFVSEWGMDGYEISDDEKKEMTAFLKFLEHNNIGWINWALSNKDEGYSFIRSECNKISEWDTDDISVSGRFVLDFLRESDE